MMKKILFFCLLLVQVLAFADAPLPTYRPWWTTGQWFGSMAAACASETNTTSTVTVNTASPTPQCKSVRQSDGYTEYFSLSTGPLKCYDGSAPNTALPLAQQCASPPPPPPPPCTASTTPFSQTFNFGTYGSATAASSILPNHIANCSISIQAVNECYKSTDGKALCNYNVSYTGAQYTGPTDSTGGPGTSTTTRTMTDPRINMPPTTSGGSCPTGSVSGGLDPSGMNICIGTGSNPTNAPPKSVITSAFTTVTNPDSSTTGTQTQISSNVDGSATTTTTTTNTAPNGTVTSSTSQTTSAPPGGGSTPGKEDRPEEASDLCKLHPELTVCRNSSVSGSCAAVSCSGDAIQCETLREVSAMACKAKTDSDALAASPLTAVGNNAINGTVTGLPTKSNASLVNVPSSLDQSGWLGGGAPFPDKSFTVQGKIIVIPFSNVTSYLLALRYALMAASMLISFRMLSGSILKV